MHKKLEMTKEEAMAIFKTLVEGFELLKKHEIEIIVNSAKLKHFAKGEYLLQAGQISKHCYLVVSGLVREFHISNGDEKTTEFYYEGSPVNSFTSSLEQSPSKSNLIAAEDTWVTVGTQSLELAMCQQIPRLEHIIRVEVERNTGVLQNKLATFISSSPQERYTNLLSERPDLFQRVPQHQIASYLGITPESLSRLRKRLLEKS